MDETVQEPENVERGQDPTAERLAEILRGLSASDPDIDLDEENLSHLLEMSPEEAMQYFRAAAKYAGQDPDKLLERSNPAEGDQEQPTEAQGE